LDHHQKPITRTGVGDLWGWGVVNPWPGEGTYTQGFFSHGSSYPMFNKSRVGFRAEALVFAGFSGSEASFSEKA
jgi:hypothetical protein